MCRCCPTPDYSTSDMDIEMSDTMSKGTSYLSIPLLWKSYQCFLIISLIRVRYDISMITYNQWWRPQYIEVNQQNACYIVMARLIKVYEYSSHKCHQEKNDWMIFMLNAIAYDRSSQPSLAPNFRTPIVFTEDSWVNNESRMTECWAKL